MHNQSELFSSSLFPMEETYNSIRDAQTILMPLICGLGFVTNLLSLVVFLQPSLRHLACSRYLAAKAVTDFLFLMTVFLIWLSRVDVMLFHTHGICQLVIFFSYLTAFLSVWLAVVLTVENLLCVCKPWYVQKSCNSHSALITILTITFLGIIVYHFSLWNNGVRAFPTHDMPFSNSHTETDLPNHYNSSNDYLQRKRQANENVKPTSRHNDPPADFLLTPDMESFPLLNQNLNNSQHSNQASEFSSSVHQSLHLFQSFNKSALSRNATSDIGIDAGDPRCMQLNEYEHIVVAITYIDSFITMFIPLLILAIANAVIAVLAVRHSRKKAVRQLHKVQYGLPPDLLAKRRYASTSLETQASKFLFAVSMTTLLCHFPSHVIRLKALISGYTMVDILLQRVFETVYYAHFASGLFIYLIFGANFRRVFFTLTLSCFKRLKKKCSCIANNLIVSLH